MTPEIMRQQLKSADLSVDEIFNLVRAVAYFHQKPGSDLVDALDLIIRLIDRRNDFEGRLKGVSAMISAIAREAGLYPYVEGRGNWSDTVATELMRVPGFEDTVFHIEQAVVFHKLASGRSIILSAPTSFGKSLLIDALISFKKPKTVVAVVPTIALLDEFRRRMELKFDEYQIITRTTESRVADSAIYIGTQERLLERSDLSEIDLFVIDEFYKLDLDRSDERSLALNAILGRYGKRAKQVYLLGPSINDVPNASTFRAGIEFYKTRYSPVTADLIDRTKVGPSAEQLVTDLVSVAGSSSLIYVRSPPAAWQLAYKLINARLRRRSDFCVELSEWLAEHVHPEWVLVPAIRRGFAMHHGRIPRSLAYIFISLFNAGELAAIICTSSMIEGINTKAENVFIFDKKISTSKLDRFTFDNIKGRAGRMFKHKIGRIFLYNAPPEDVEFDVRVPLFNSDELMSPELLLKIQDDELTPIAQRRRRAITESSSLPANVLEAWAEFGIDKMNGLAEYLRINISDSPSLLRWSGFPTYEQIEATFDVAWTTLDFNKHHITSARQLALYANRLRSAPTLRAFISSLVDATGDEAQGKIDHCFSFLRGAEFTFPQVLRAMNDIIDSVIGLDIVNYRVYATALQNHFLPGDLRALDEYGVPLPIVRRIAHLLPIADINACRILLRHPTPEIVRMLTEFELELIRRGLG